MSAYRGIIWTCDSCGEVMPQRTSAHELKPPAGWVRIQSVSGKNRVLDQCQGCKSQSINEGSKFGPRDFVFRMGSTWYRVMPAEPDGKLWLHHWFKANKCWIQIRKIVDDWPRKHGEHNMFFTLCEIPANVANLHGGVPFSLKE